jgi:hypothetical protein
MLGSKAELADSIVNSAALSKPDARLTQAQVCMDDQLIHKIRSVPEADRRWGLYQQFAEYSEQFQGQLDWTMSCAWDIFINDTEAWAAGSVGPNGDSLTQLEGFSSWSKAFTRHNLNIQTRRSAILTIRSRWSSTACDLLLEYGSVTMLPNNLNYYQRWARFARACDDVSEAIYRVNGCIIAKLEAARKSKRAGAPPQPSVKPRDLNQAIDGAENDVETVIVTKKLMDRHKLAHCPFTGLLWDSDSVATIVKNYYQNSSIGSDINTEDGMGNAVARIPSHRRIPLWSPPVQIEQDGQPQDGPSQDDSQLARTNQPQPQRHQARVRRALQSRPRYTGRQIGRPRGNQASQQVVRPRGDQTSSADVKDEKEDDLMIYEKSNIILCKCYRSRILPLHALAIRPSVGETVYDSQLFCLFMTQIIASFDSQESPLILCTPCITILCGLINANITEIRELNYASDEPYQFFLKRFEISTQLGIPLNEQRYPWVLSEYMWAKRLFPHAPNLLPYGCRYGTWEDFASCVKDTNKSISDVVLARIRDEPDSEEDLVPSGKLSAAKDLDGGNSSKEGGEEGDEEMEKTPSPGERTITNKRNADKDRRSGKRQATDNGDIGSSSKRR